jgi:putative glutamine amidotransferase
MSDLPIVCIPCNHIKESDVPTYAVRDQYVRPLTEIVKCIPLLIPALGRGFSLRNIADKVDGILLTGAPSHLNPSCYGAERTFEDSYLDTDRDETDLPLIRDAIEMDIPLFAICRGFQELNVACGGTLHQFVHEQPGKLDHRPPQGVTGAKRYEIHQHKIHAQKGGLFERLNMPTEFPVNSLHQQGVDKLGAGLHVEGISEDGLIEAVSVPGKRFIFGAQFHPEGDFWLNPTSKTLFDEFARAVHQTHYSKNEPDDAQTNRIRRR